MPTHEQKPDRPYQCTCNGWATSHLNPNIDEEFQRHLEWVERVEQDA